MAGNLCTLGLGGGIKSIQRGVIVTTSLSTAPVTISSVDPAKSILSVLGQTANPTSLTFSTITLTYATTITATTSQNSVNASSIGWQLVEYY